MKTIAQSVLFVAACAAALIAPAARAAVEVGQPAPNFTLTDIDGHTHSLADYKGKTVVLEWNNPDCPIVKKHYDSENIPKLQRDATKDGVVWLIVNSGAPGLQGGDYSAADLKAWLGEHHAAPTSYLRDPSGKIGHLYHAQTTPHMFVIKADGTLAYAGAIDSIPSANKSDIPKATNYIQTALGAIKAGQPIEQAQTKPYGCAVKYGSKSDT
jgi:hypothetical protein